MVPTKKKHQNGREFCKCLVDKYIYIYFTKLRQNKTTPFVTAVKQIHLDQNLIQKLGKNLNL